MVKQIYRAFIGVCTIFMLGQTVNADIIEFDFVKGTGTVWQYRGPDKADSVIMHPLGQVEMRNAAPLLCKSKIVDIGVDDDMNIISIRIGTQVYKPTEVEMAVTINVQHLMTLLLNSQHKGKVSI